MLNQIQYAKIQTDEASTTVTYVGYAETNFVLDGDPAWAILKIEQASASTPNGVTTFKWAGAGSPGLFENIWTNRASLTYSS